MKSGAHTVIFLAVNGLFLLLDRILKLKAILDKGPTDIADNQLFGWQPFYNYGIALGIQLPQWVTISLTIGIIILLATLFYKTNRSTDQFSLALIITGAISNLYDRIFFGYTVDYFRFFTSIINLADIYVVAGFIIYLLQWRDAKTQS